MRRLIVWNMMAPLDGYFDRPKPWEIEEFKRFSLDQAREAGTLLFGRKTYERMAGYWSTAIGEIAEFMKALPKVVFSNTLATADWGNTRLVRGSAADEVSCLKQGTGKDLFIFASTGLAGSLARAGLIDEFRIGLNPLAVERETPVLESSDEGMRLKFAEVRPLQSGVVLLRYARAYSISGAPRRRTIPS